MKKLLTILGIMVFTGCSATDNLLIKTPAIQIEQIKSPNDHDKDGIDDSTDIVEGARSLIGVVTAYDTSYYADAYPPSNKGACADVIWRSLQAAGIDFKSAIDEDMKDYSEDYPANPIQDKNINFRRVQNIRIYLSKHAKNLTTEVVPGNKENLTQWQGGDIVTFAQIPGGLWHVAIVSTKRRSDGVPYLIHNYGQGVKESDYLLNWPTPITGHFRLI